MNRITFSVLLCLIASKTFAEPIYLDCDVASKTESQLFSVKVDEDSGKITHSQPGGYAFNTEGFFGSDKIQYQKIDSISGLRMTRLFEISRVDLSASFITKIESIKLPDQVPSDTLVKIGSCKIVKVKERKF